MWIVEMIAVGGELVPLIEGTMVTLESDGEQVGGEATINRYRGSLGDETLFGPLATTMMAGPEDHMAQEHIYLSHLGKADDLEIDNDEMKLLSGGLVIVTLRRVGTPEASETSNT